MILNNAFTAESFTSNFLGITKKNFVKLREIFFAVYVRMHAA